MAGRRIYRRGRIWWIRYYHEGKEYRESSRSHSKRDALKLMDQRVMQRETGALLPQQNTTTFDDLVELLRDDYVINQRRSLDTVMFHVKHLRQTFGLSRAVQITSDRIASYQASRLEAGASVATVNRETAALSRMLRLAVEKKRLAVSPPLKYLRGENVRQGFITPEDFEAVVPYLPEYLRGLVEFLYQTGWRRKEGQTLRWLDVDQKGGIVRLRIENSKNKEPRVYPLAGRVLELIQEAQQRRRLDCPFVFHRNGKQIQSFRKAWRTACDAAGLGHIVPHDMKRSAARNLSRAGVRAEVAMKLIGHKTPSMWRRYRIVDEGELADAANLLDSHIKEESKKTRRSTSILSKNSARVSDEGAQ